MFELDYIIVERNDCSGVETQHVQVIIFYGNSTLRNKYNLFIEILFYYGKMKKNDEKVCTLENTCSFKETSAFFVLPSTYLLLCHKFAGVQIAY